MRVNFKSQKLSRKDKKKKRVQEYIQQKEDESMAVASNEQSVADKLETKGLSKAKRQQIFKKHKKKDIQAQIKELKIQSKKLKKKDVS